MAIHANADRDIILRKAFDDRKLLWPFAPNDSLSVVTPAANSMVLSKMAFCPQIGTTGIAMRGNWRDITLPMSFTVHLTACYSLLDECHCIVRQFF